jgi:hypothetical protein
MPLIKYIGPIDVVEIAAVGALVARGSTVDVPADIAGTPPTAAFLAAMDAVAKADNAIPRDHATCAAARLALIDVMDGTGSGLLAQHEAWQVVAAPKDKTPKDGE